MGEKQNEPFQLSFNASLKVDFKGSLFVSDEGLILAPESDERLEFGELIVALPVPSGNDQYGIPLRGTQLIEHDRSSFTFMQSASPRPQATMKS